MSTFIWEDGYDLKEGSTSDFIKWLSTHEGDLKAAAPKGIDYLGTFAVVQSTEKTAGHFRTLWGANSYGDMDTFAAAVGKGEFGRLMDEVGHFIDQRNAACGSSSTLKAATATTYWGED